MRQILIAIVVFGLLNSPFPGAFAATYYVSSDSGDDDAAGDQTAPWKTLQHAADKATAGDTVKIATGTYAGFRAKSGGSSGSPIVFMADDGASPLLNVVSADCIKGSIVEIEEFDWWVIDGLEIRDAPQHAGVDVRVADHVTVRNCVCLYNNTWGIFTGYAEYFTAEYNECAYSAEEHGIYHSNSADNAVIRYNICHHNYGCGIQINADPRMDGDGISSCDVVSHNILYENGNGGGAAINLASVRDSLIANNLIYMNHAGGIAAWDDGYYDEFHSYEFGCKNNKFYNNTVHMPSDGRWALNMINGSTGNSVENNILVHDSSYRGGIETDSSSLTGLSSDYNAMCRASVDDDAMDLSGWQSTYSADQHSQCRTAAQIFEAPGSDYHFLEGSFPHDEGTTLAEVADDLEGNSRPQGAGYDIGAYEQKFCDNDPVMILGGDFFTSVQDAIDAAVHGDTILCEAVEFQDGIVLYELPAKTVEIIGGYDCVPDGNPTGTTTLGGQVSIESGAIILSGGALAIE